jgi:CBS domain-containing protein
MKVKCAMNSNVKACRAEDPLNMAAQMMWDNACGSMPVVDEQFRPIGFLTDRDICMAAYTQGKSLTEIAAASAMARKVFSCSLEDDVDQAAHIMQQSGVRRLPVVGADGRLVGILSLDDLAVESTRTLRGTTDCALAALVGRTFIAVSSSRARRRAQRLEVSGASGALEG